MPEDTGLESVDLLVRVPEWSRDDWQVSIDGTKRKVAVVDGFFAVNVARGTRHRIELDFDYSVHVMRANSHVSADAGRVAFTAGPIVFCAEQADNPGNLWGYRMHLDDALQRAQLRFGDDLLGGANTVSVPADREDEDSTHAPLYERMTGPRESTPHRAHTRAVLWHARIAK